MATLSGRDGVGQAGHRGPMAPSGLPPVLALAPGSGRPSVDRKVHKLIREMNTANPLGGAPRIHGELLNFGLGQAAEPLSDKPPPPSMVVAPA